MAAPSATRHSGQKESRYIAWYAMSAMAISAPTKQTGCSSARAKRTGSSVAISTPKKAPRPSMLVGMPAMLPSSLWAAAEQACSRGQNSRPGWSESTTRRVLATTATSVTMRRIVNRRAKSMSGGPSGLPPR